MDITRLRTVGVPLAASFLFACSITAFGAMVPSEALADDLPKVEIPKKYQEEVERTTAAYEDAQKKVDDAEAAIKANREDIAQIEKQIPEQKERTAQAIRDQYKLGKQSGNVIEVLLDSGDISDAILKVDYISRVSEANAAEIDKLADMKGELEKHEKDLVKAEWDAKESAAKAKDALDAAKEARQEAQRKAQEEARRQAELIERARRIEAAKAEALSQAMTQRPGFSEEEANESTSTDGDGALEAGFVEESSDEDSLSVDNVANDVADDVEADMPEDVIGDAADSTDDIAADVVADSAQGESNDESVEDTGDTEIVDGNEGSDESSESDADASDAAGDEGLGGDADAATEEDSSDLDDESSVVVEMYGNDSANADLSVASDGANGAADGEEQEFDNSIPLSMPTDDGANWKLDKDDFVKEWGPRIDNYLAGSALAGQGNTFAKAAWTYGIDPRWSPAISNTESSRGAICFKPHNAWGWGDSSWSSWEEAIDAHVAGLSKGYGYTITVAGAQTYCPPNWVHWYNDTISEMNRI